MTRSATTGRLRRALVLAAVGGAGAVVAGRGAAALAATALPREGAMPSLAGAGPWLNSAPIAPAALQGKVVLIDFWTYGCSNCLNALPSVREWHRKYRDDGLVVIGVHSPESAAERELGNVRREVQRLKIDFPVAIDNDFAVWRAFGNRFWPAQYFVDARGQIRFRHVGEGDYAQSEEVIRQLLREAKGAGAGS